VLKTVIPNGSSAGPVGPTNGRKTTGRPKSGIWSDSAEPVHGKHTEVIMGQDDTTTGRDSVFTGTDARASDFQFNEEVAGVFDDMLARSVPGYNEQQSLIREIAARFYVPDSKVYDLGCSIGTTLMNIGQAIDDSAELVGYDNSNPMLERARENVDKSGLGDRVDLRYADLNSDVSDLDLDAAGVVTLCWTLQFIRPLARDRLIRKIYESLNDGGVFICCEKILTNDSDMNRFFVDFYYDFKRRNGYSEDEILRKREALENVLVPYRADENFELFRRNGFQIVETFFQWYNFCGFLCVKKT
jgi:tRNA (cmo5U34)-methyltransferase